MNNEPQNSDDLLVGSQRTREDAMALNPLIDTSTSATLERCKNMAHALGRLLGSAETQDTFMKGQLNRVTGFINCALAFEQRRLDVEVVTGCLR